MNIAEEARRKGVSPGTIRRWIKQRRDAEAVRRAEVQSWRFDNETAGWNPRAGNTKRNKGV